MTNYKMFSEEILGPVEKVFSIPLYIGHSISNFPMLLRSCFENGQKLLMFQFHVSEICTKHQMKIFQ